MFQSILAATDRITERDPVVISAARLAKSLNVPWSIVHVLESASLSNRQRILHYLTGEEQNASAPYCTDARRQLSITYRDLLSWAPPFDIVIRTGFPWEEINRQSSLFEVDLIIMGPHAAVSSNRSALRVLGRIGSTVEGVLTQNRCPVLIINQYPCRPRPLFKRLLVGIDFSKSCESALHFAASLARFHHAHIDLFHMLPISPYPKYTRKNYDRDRAKMRDRMASLYRSQLGGIPHRYLCWGGAHPYRELLKCMDRCQTDVVVLGSHTKERQGKWYAGSTVEKISFQAASPVFVLTDPGALPSLVKDRSLTAQPISA